MDKYNGTLIRQDNPSIVYKAYLTKSKGRSDGRMTGFIIEKDDPTKKRVIVFPDDQIEKGVLSGVMIMQGSSNREHVRGMMALPYAAQIEYIESNKTQYIDTGIVVNDTDVIKCGCMFLSKSGDNHAFGSSSQAPSGGLWCEIYSNNGWYVRFGSSVSSNSSAGASINTLKNIVLKKSYFSVNGTLILQPSYVSMPPNTIKIFGNNSPSARVRIYNFSIEDNLGNKRIDLIPVRVGSVGYMYDRVSGQLFGNMGTGDFVLGPDVQ